MATKKINTDLQLTAKLLDGSGSAGTSGQILSSTGTVTDWINLSDISGVDGSGSAERLAVWSDSDTISYHDNLRWDGEKLMVESGNSSTSSKTVSITHTRNDSNVSTQAITIDANFSGADTTTADRTNAGLYIDLDSSADGDASNEVRSYGVWVDARITGYNDLLRGGYFFVESNNTTEKTAEIAGVYGLATHDSSSTNGGVSNMFGVRGVTAIQDYGDVDNTYAVHGLVQIANNRNANVDNTHALYGEIQIDEATALSYGSMYGCRVVIDNNEGSVPTFSDQYLFYGAYQGTTATGAYGIYVQGDRHYLAGSVGIGENNPVRDLQIKKSTSGGQVRAEVFNTSNTANSHGVVSIYSGGSSAGDPFLHWKVDAVQDWSMGIDNSDSDKLKISKNFGPGVNDYLTIATTGYVGIGTTSPSVQLDIEDSSNVLIDINTTTANANTTIRFQESGSNTATIGYDGTNDGLILTTGGFTAGNGIFIDNSQNVGIGRTNPLAALHIDKAGVPQLLLDGGGNTTGDIVVPNGEILQMGHWNTSTSTYTDRLRIAADGNVGIGTTSPTNGKLEIQSSTNQISVNTGTAGDGRLHIGHFSNGTFIGTYGDDGGAADLIRFGTHSGDERMRVASNGNVGIGETSIDARLHISTAAAGLVNQKFESVGSAAWRVGIPASQTYFAFDNANDNLSAPKVVIDSGGQVGIGTPSPSYNLHILDGDPYIALNGTTSSDDISLLYHKGGTLNLIARASSTVGGQVDIVSRNNTGDTDLANFENTGRLVLPQYGSGTFTGTAQKMLAVDATGNVIEETLPAGPGGIGAGTYGSTADDTKIDTITVDAYGRVTAIATGETGEVQTVSAGTNLNSVGTSTDVTLNLDSSIDLTSVTTDELSYPYPTATNQFHGEIVTFGSFNGTIVAGDVIVYTTAGVQTGWFLAQGNVTYSKGMLGIAMGTTPSAGILIKGFARHASFASGNLGSPLYLSPSTAGDTTSTIPSSTNNIVRIVGYMLNPTNDEIFFDPDKSWVQVS